MAKVYNSKEVSLVVNGLTVTGYAQDMIKIEPVQKEKIKTDSGAQGDFVHSQNHDERHKITVSLWQNSPTCIVFQGLLESNMDFPIMVKNTSDGAYLGAATSAVINERPTVEFGSEIKAMQWVITAADYKSVFG